MDKLAVMGMPADYEEKVIAFVQNCFTTISEHWRDWLKQNPLSPDIIALLSDGEKVKVSDAQHYKIEPGNGELQFLELNKKDAEWPRSGSKISLELKKSRPARSLVRKAGKADRYDLVLRSIGYRLLTYPEFNAVLLHLDFVIEKVDFQFASEVQKLPERLPQQTFMEARNMAKALSDGPALTSWELITGGVGMRHIIPGNPLQTRILLPQEYNPWDLPRTCEELARELQNLELASVLLLNVVLGCVLQRPKMAASIDDLINAIGWQPRSRNEREELRRKIWRWLLLFDSMCIYGKRPGKYWDKLTHKEIDLTSADAFIRVTGKRFAEKDGEDESETPLEVSWVAGAWLDQWRGNERILQYFGDIRKIALIPAGKPSGAWAQSIGLALNQYWREQAARADVHHVGEENKLTARFEPFTRYQLLNLFRSEPWVEDILTSSNPQRAQLYWKEAIRILRYDAGIVSYYEELDEAREKRKGWQEFWLKYQRLDIRPKQEETMAIAEISRTAARARRNAQRTKRKR